MKSGELRWSRRRRLGARYGSYTGAGCNYSSGRAQGDLGDDVRYSYAVGATVTIPFTGSGISWLAQRSDQTGPVEVYVDGSDQGVIAPRTSGVSWVAPRLSDTGSVRVFVDGIDEGELTSAKGAAAPSARQVNYSVTGLVPGVHSLKIVNGGAGRLAVDALTVLV